MKKIKIIFLGSITLFIILLVGGCIMVKWSALGQSPKGELFENIKKSDHYDEERGEFVNRRPELLKKMRKDSFDFSLIKDWFKGTKDGVPKNKLPEVRPDFKEFLKKSSDIKVIWFGHSTFLLNLNQTIVLVDPVFSKTASPVNFVVKRFQKVVASLDQLPPIDIILISHDHYDHLDMESIQFFRDHNETQFVTPLGISSHLASWGIDSTRVTERDWWQNIKVKDITFTATPAQHFSGRDGLNNNQTLWASWVLEYADKRLFFSGDSGYDTHFKEIGERFGDFDIAFMESGQYNQRWRAVHMLPEEGAQAFKDLKAKRYFPVHWGMFELSLHSWYEPVEKLDTLSIQNNFQMVTPIIGETTIINDNYIQNKWWKKEI